MDLFTRINSKTANIGVIGMGYVGLPLVIEFCRAGFQVTGFDIDINKIALLREGKSYIKHISATTIGEIVGSFNPAPNSVIPATLLGGNPACNCLKSWMPDKSIRA